VAKPEVVNMMSAQAKSRARTEAETEAELRQLADRIEGKEVVLKVRAGSKEQLYGSITAADIAAELEKVAGVAVDRRRIELAEPIHQLGSYEVNIRLGKDIVPKVKIEVTEETA
jgi:large subunit ribosomal protein L9